MQTHFGQHAAWFGLVSLAGALLTGCDTEPVAIEVWDGQVLDGTEWVLTAIQTPTGTIDATVLENPAWVGFAVDILGVDGSRAYGFDGCNGFSGTYRQVEWQLTVSDLISTLIGCGDSVTRVAYPFMSALRGALRFSLSGEALRIECRGDPVLYFSVRSHP